MRQKQRERERESLLRCVTKLRDGVAHKKKVAHITSWNGVRGGELGMRNFFGRWEGRPASTVFRRELAPATGRARGREILPKKKGAAEGESLLLRSA